MKIHYLLAFLILHILFEDTPAIAQQTVGLIFHDEESTDDGYVLLAPLPDTISYLIDKCGYVVHKWTGKYTPGMAVYLLPDSKLLRTGVDKENLTFVNGGKGGHIELVDWNSNILWRYKLSDNQYCLHHDVKMMPNGHILAIVWELKSRGQAMDAGRNPLLLNSALWSEKIIEIEPLYPEGGRIVWEWKVWDHLVQDYDRNAPNYGKIKDYPGRIDLNFIEGLVAPKDWLHINSIDYNPELDQILLSVHTFSEFWIIDHSTTIAEAATSSGGRYGKGGELLYRWGNPRTYTNTDNQYLYSQHNASWIPKGYPYEGAIMVFNNGFRRAGEPRSSVDIIYPPQKEDGSYDHTPLPYLPRLPAWSYSDPPEFYSQNISGAQMLKNGHVLICQGYTGVLFEINEDKATVWKYISPVDLTGLVQQGDEAIFNPVFRAYFYPYDYQGISGIPLYPTVPVELNPQPYECLLNTPTDIHTESSDQPSLTIFPNPAHSIIQLDGGMKELLQLYDALGNIVATAANSDQIDIRHVKSGWYMLSVSHQNKSVKIPVIVNR